MNQEEDGIDWSNVFYSSSDDTITINTSSTDTTFDITNIGPTTYSLD